MNRLKCLDSEWIDSFPHKDETWPYQFQLRAKEFDLLLQNVHLPSSLNRTLEIGSGNGFQAVLLSIISGHVVATDLPNPDFSTHTIGYEKARRLFSASGQTNVSYTGCSGAVLPFADQTFDLIFSAYVLEHLSSSDRERAMQESARVLKNGGLMITVVPSFMERVYYPLIYYPSFLYSMIEGALRVFGVKKRSSHDHLIVHDADGDLTASAINGDRFSRLKHYFQVYHPTFPFPKPHGEFRSSWDEMLACRPAKWLELHQSNGFVARKTFCTILLPVNLITAVSRRLGTKFYENTADYVQGLALKQPFKYLGLNFVIIAEKR
jgi:ubiquinone/menaquinone biosynthesis C-methylase UbiE